MYVFKCEYYNIYDYIYISKTIILVVIIFIK